MNMLGQNLLDGLAVRAGEAPRKRAHHNLHASADDPVQRFFVVVDRASYIRPHRHRTRWEMALVLRGRFDIVTFDDSGTVLARSMVGEGTDAFGYEAPSMGWHTLIARNDGAAFLEIKQGPYDPATAAEFAPWAPAEGTPEVPAWLDWARAASPGSQFATSGSGDSPRPKP